jgi:chromosome partitioning protein
MLARALAAAGKKVVLADSDLNNSMSFHFLDEGMMERTRKLNFASALSDENNNLCDYTVPTTTPGIDLIASTPYLADLRTLNEKRLKRMIPTLYEKYDILIIDCHPTYDNIVLNALHSSDYIITPVLMDLFSYNAASFMAGVLPRDLENSNNWFVLLNGYNKRYEESKSGRQNDFYKLYADKEFPLTPKETWMPWTAQIHQVIDYHRLLSNKIGTPGAVQCPDLYNAVTELAGCFFDEAPVIPEAF